MSATNFQIRSNPSRKPDPSLLKTRKQRSSSLTLTPPDGHDHLVLNAENDRRNDHSRKSCLPNKKSSYWVPQK